MRNPIVNFAPLTMSTRLQKGLAETFPLITGHLPPQTLILCGDGWHAVIARGLADIQSFCDLCSDGEYRLQVHLEQIQERDGSLCFYHKIDGGDDFEREILRDIVRSMELSSLYFCEITGTSPACLCRRGPRLRTLCYEAAIRDGYELCSPDYESGWAALNRPSPDHRPDQGSSTQGGESPARSPKENSSTLAREHRPTAHRRHPRRHRRSRPARPASP